MDDFVEQIARLSELSDEELASLETEIVAAFDAADEAADIEQMQSLADMLDQVRAEIAARDSVDTGGATEEIPEEEIVASAEASAEVATEVADPASTEPPEAPEVSDTETPLPIDTPQDEDPEATTNESEVPVATEITADDVPAEHIPDAVTAAPVTIRAGGDIPGITAGSELNSIEDVTDALTRKINSMRGVSGNGEQIIVASIQHPEVGEDHILRSGDPEGNARKMRAFISNPEMLTPDALTAGGWCAPRVPIYDVPTVGTTERPLRDGLPTFRADRGGITLVQPPTLPDVNGAVSLWRFDENAGAWRAYTDPAGTVSASPNDEKPILKVSCGSEYSADVDAVPLAVTFDNMMAKAFPEWVRSTTELVQVAQARFAEQKSLAQLFALAATGTAGQVSISLGVARDFFRGVTIAAAQKRHQHRMAADAQLQLVAPQWLGVAIAVDLGLGQDFDVHSRSEVNGYFSEINISPIWTIDDVPGQAAFTSLSAFPATAHWLLFPTGTYVRLDNGELNLGVVRTKEDVVKNQYTEFAETFETVAHFGPGGYAWTVYGQTTVALKGSYPAPTDVS